MSSSKEVSATTGGGIGLGGVLGVAFVILKLCGVIHWSWLWVLSPFWIPFAVMLVILLVMSVIFAIGAVCLGLAKYLDQRKSLGR